MISFAIPLAAMHKSAFYVTIALDGVRDGGCAVGRTGTVAFSIAGSFADSTGSPATWYGDALASLRAFLF